VDLRAVAPAGAIAGRAIYSRRLDGEHGAGCDPLRHGAPEPVQDQLVTLEEAQGAVENIEQGEGITGVIRLVCQPLDQALVLVDVLFRSANAVLDDSKVIAFGSHLIAPKGASRPHLIVIAVTVTADDCLGQINSEGQVVSESRRQAAISLRAQPAVR